MLPSSQPAAVLQTDLRQLLEELYQGRSLYPYCSGQSIPMAPHEILVICRGLVQLSTLYSTGDEALLGIVGPSMPFGLPLSAVHPYQAIALSDVDLMRLSLAEIEASPRLYQEMLRHLSRRLRQTEALLALQGHRRIRDRLCQLLLLLQQEIGQPVAAGTRLSVRLTHQHLASTIGTTRVTVTRILGQLKAEEWLLLDRTRHIVIPFNSVS